MQDEKMGETKMRPSRNSLSSTHWLPHHNPRMDLHRVQRLRHRPHKGALSGRNLILNLRHISVQSAVKNSALPPNHSLTTSPLRIHQVSDSQCPISGSNSESVFLDRFLHFFAANLLPLTAAFPPRFPHGSSPSSNTHESSCPPPPSYTSPTHA